MKISLAFCLHDVEADIQDVLSSWLDRCSEMHDIEVICVFDDCHDRSAEVAYQYMQFNYPYVPYQPFVTDNIWEVRCNNLALKHATGDIICMAQGDNFQHSLDWDNELLCIMDENMPVGAVGLLAGVRFHKDFNYDRIECHRPHKDERVWVHGIAKDAYPLSVYEVDVINRPFAVQTDLLRNYGGLDEAYCPMDWDDADLSFKLLRDGYTNLYIPFDVVNLCGKKETLTHAEMSANYQHGEAIARARWGQFVAARESSFRALYPYEGE